MRRTFETAVGLTLLGLVTGCNGGSSSSTPNFAVQLSTTRLQLAVGTATFPGGSVNLNVVTTFRQANGLSAVYYNTPTLTGPSGFSVPSVPSAGGDAGTNRITGSPPTKGTPTATTFGLTGGAFAYGFAPDNTMDIGAPTYVPYGGDGTGAPFYATQFQTLPATTGWPFPCAQGDCVPFLGGPPLFPATQNGTYPAGFFGFSEGFTTFAMTPVAGTYNLSTTVPATSYSGSGTLNAPAATLTSIGGLPAYPTPTFVESPSLAGGGTVTVAAPAGVFETLVDIVDITTPSFYTLEVTGTGTKSVILPDMLGPASAGSSAPSLKSGDTYIVTAIGFDYPAFEAAGPANTTQLPTLTGGNGQADVTISPYLEGVYSSSAGVAAHQQRQP